MALKLHPVAPRQGLLWVHSALLTFVKHPIAFVGLFMAFLFGVLLLLVVPWVGGLMGMTLFPMLTLGYMIATRSALAGGKVNPLQLIDGLRAPPASRRRAQWLLCLGYALATVGVIEFAHWVDGGTFEQLQQAMARGDAQTQVQALLADPRLLDGMLVRFALAGMVSVPFWFAPALVHWAHQGLVQSLFTSTLAVWRAKAAFAVYSLAFAALLALAALLLGAIGGLLGARQLAGMLALPLGLVFSAVFYVSLWFGFADCFGAHQIEET